MPKNKTPSDVSKLIKDHEVKLVDFKFTDLPGAWQHFTTTLTEYNEDIFTEGLGFDGSSIRGWKVINASDMLVIPDPSSAWIDIFNAEPTLSLICTIVEPITREPYNRDPRGVAEKAEAYLQSTGIADTAFFGPEAEFFIFDGVSVALGTAPHTRSIAQKDIGTAAGRSFQISATKSARRRDIFRSRRPTRCRTSAVRCASNSRRPAFRSNASTTKWRRRARPRSISVSRRSR
jgi:glutamine synthetase